MAEGALGPHIQYWRQELAGITSSFADGLSRPPIVTHSGDMLRFHYPPELRSRLRELAQQEGATLFMALLAGFLLLLYKYTGQDESPSAPLPPIAIRGRQRI